MRAWIVVFIFAVLALFGAGETFAAEDVATSNGAARNRLGNPRQLALPPVPPAPTVVARRTGNRVRIAYSFSVWPEDDRRPVLLLTAVQSSGTRYAPYMKRHAISKRIGVVWQPLGLGKAPFKLFAAAYSKLGRSSKTVSVPVRGD